MEEVEGRGLTAFTGTAATKPWELKPSTHQLNFSIEVFNPLLSPVHQHCGGVEGLLGPRAHEQRRSTKMADSG